LDLNKSLQRLSSGLRINRAADDAAGLAIAEGFNSQVRGFRVAQRNTQDGISLVQTAEGALSEISNMLQRIRELAVQAANGTLSTANRTALELEGDELSIAIGEILTRTDFNGIDPFGATAVAIQTGTENTETTTLVGTGVALTTATLNVEVGDITFTTAATSGTTIATVDAAIDAISVRRSQLGAAQNRLEFTVNVLGIQEENSLSAESAIRDADIARETIAFTRAQILVTAGTSILAQSNILPQTALQLVG
jgi:flagellin